MLHVLENDVTSFLLVIEFLVPDLYIRTITVPQKVIRNIFIFYYLGHIQGISWASWSQLGHSSGIS